VLVGHRKDHLPVARAFYTETVEHKGRPWVKSYFYWLKSADNSEELCDNIDGGIYKECSIAFTFSMPECSICQKDIRNCSHEPFEKYNQQGTQILCHFNYRQIEKVLESSLIYRGANPGTSLGKVKPVKQKLQSLKQLEQDRKYLVIPRYEGLDIVLSLSDNSYRLQSSDGHSFEIPFDNRLKGIKKGDSHKLYGKLVGYRGRERCSRKQLLKYLNKELTRVSRIVLHLYPGQTICKAASIQTDTPLEIKGIPYRMTTVVDLSKKSREIMTRYGVEIRELNSPGVLPIDGENINLIYHPDSIKMQARDHYRIIFNREHDSTILTICHDNKEISFLLGVVQLKELNDGLCFPADQISSNEIAQYEKSLVCSQGDIEQFKQQENGIRFNSKGALSGCYQLRPLRHHNKESYFFYQVDPPEHKQHRFNRESEMGLPQ